MISVGFGISTPRQREPSRPALDNFLHPSLDGQAPSNKCVAQLKTIARIEEGCTRMDYRLALPRLHLHDHSFFRASTWQILAGDSAAKCTL